MFQWKKQKTSQIWRRHDINFDVFLLLLFYYTLPNSVLYCNSIFILTILFVLNLISCKAVFISVAFIGFSMTCFSYRMCCSTIYKTINFSFQYISLSQVCTKYTIGEYFFKFLFLPLNNLPILWNHFVDLGYYYFYFILFCQFTRALQIFSRQCVCVCCILFKGKVWGVFLT